MYSDISGRSSGLSMRSILLIARTAGLLIPYAGDHGGVFANGLPGLVASVIIKTTSAGKGRNCPGDHPPVHRLRRFVDARVSNRI